MELSDFKKLKALASENAKLMTLLAERDLEIEAMRRLSEQYPTTPSGGT